MISKDIFSRIDLPEITVTPNYVVEDDVFYFKLNENEIIEIPKGYYKYVIINEEVTILNNNKIFKGEIVYFYTNTNIYIKSNLNNTEIYGVRMK